MKIWHQSFTVLDDVPHYRDALERHFDPVTARLLDAMIEGLTIHRALDTKPQDPSIVTDVIERVVNQSQGSR